jgi:hypothetical protein
MNFDLDDVALSVESELTRFADERRTRIGELGPRDPDGWRSLADFGLLHGVGGGMRHLDVAIGMTAAAQGGLPGPVLEAALACASGSESAVALVGEGKLVSSVPPGPAGPVIVGWGSLSELVVDQGTGAILAEGPLPEVGTALPMGHGSIDRVGGTTDPLQGQRWLYGSALAVGLGLGAVHMATEYVKTRHQFGRALASFQAVQFRLAESILALDAARLMVLDAARRADAGDSLADTTAALAWVYTSKNLEQVEKNVHQVFGAMGFTVEMGLIRMTYQSAWLRTSIGRRDALAAVSARRSHPEPTPPSVIMDGFAAV